MLENKFLPDGTRIRNILASGSEWQIVKTSSENSALIVLNALYQKWLNDGLIGENLFVPVENEVNKLKNEALFVLTCRKNYLISSIQKGPYPHTIIEARAFAVSLREMRKNFSKISFHDAIYIEQFSLLLPAYTQTDLIDDDIILGSWLSGGVRVSALSFGELCKLLNWLSPREIKAIVQEAGFTIERDYEQNKIFTLPGRPMLEKFFNEHVIEIIQNEEKYRKVGINFPSAIVLYGPPGCGKTFAVDELVKFLDWPCYKIDSGTIGSPYIHDTSRKTAEIFEEAARNSPSVIVIDEMDAFLSDRTANNSGNYHIEEVSEFLRRIPEAPGKNILVIAMTNRIDAIDPAVLRHGRFDHVIEVTMPEAEEVKALLLSLFAGLPLDDGVNLSELAQRLAGRPLSDAAFVVKEAGRLSVKAGKEIIDAEAVKSACELLFQSQSNDRKMGF